MTTVRERVIRRFGGIDKVPDYLIRALGLRKAAEERREQEQRDHEAEVAAERARVKALRRPPQNVRLVGRVVHFEPPETADELEFAGFWVSECRNGDWTKHGGYLLPGVRSAALFGSDDGSFGPCYVETWYHQMALGEMYRSRIIHAESPESESTPFALHEPGPYVELIETVRGYVAKQGRPPAYYDRWKRVLSGLGDPAYTKTHAAMTSAEAQSYVDLGWGGRWPPVAKALRELEAGK